MATKAQRPATGLGAALGRLFGAPAKRGKPARPAYLKDEDQLNRNALARARRLAAKHTIGIERDGDAYWVGVELSKNADDPLAGNHFAVGGREVLEAVTVAAEYLASKEEGGAA